MKTVNVSKLSDSQSKILISEFLVSLGKRLKAKRTKINLSQSTLAECLDIDQTTLSKYENGGRDMQVSLLPLFSTYCNFPLYELFPRDESENILNTFGKAISITVDRKKRQMDLQLRKSTTQSYEYQSMNKILKGQVYDVNGEEVFEPVIQKEHRKSLRDRYRDVEIEIDAKPFTQTEFLSYLKEWDDNTRESVSEAGTFLEKLETLPNKETVKNVVSDFIINELIINQISEEDPLNQSAKRAYAYYKMLYEQYMRGENVN